MKRIFCIKIKSEGINKMNKKEANIEKKKGARLISPRVIHSSEIKTNFGLVIKYQKVDRSLALLTFKAPFFCFNYT